MIPNFAPCNGIRHADNLPCHFSKSAAGMMKSKKYGFFAFIINYSPNSTASMS